MPEGIGAAPHQAQRAQSGAVKHLQRVELGVDGLGALKVQDRREGATFQTAGQVCRVTHDCYLAGGTLLQSKQAGHHVERGALRRRQIDGGGQEHLVPPPAGQCDHAVGARSRHRSRGWGGHKVGEEAAGKATLPRPR
ncbi:MAG: hypothetical protein NVSMB65_10280 [Chloroflexota bacterium]